MRDGIHVIQYALKRPAQDSAHPISRDLAWKDALLRVVGEEALDLEGFAKKRPKVFGGESPPRGLGDFFSEAWDPLHPDG